MHIKTPTPCQEDNPNSKEMNVEINQDQEQILSSKPIFDQDPTYEVSYDDPLIFLYSIQEDNLPSLEKSVFPSPIQHPHPEKDYNIPSSYDLIQNQEQRKNSFHKIMMRSKEMVKMD